MPTSVRKNLAWMGVSQTFLFIIAFASSIVIARLLTPREMGVYAIAAAIVGLLNLIRAFGLNVMVVRERSLSVQDIRTIFTVNVFINMLSSAVIFATGSACSRFFGDAGIANTMYVLALSPLLSIFDFLPSALLERSGKFKAIALIGSARALVNNGLIVLLAINGFSFMSISLAGVATSLFSVICFNVIGRHYVSFRPSLRNWRAVTKFGFQMFLLNAVGGFTGRLTDLMIGRFIDLTALGLYSRAVSMNNLLWENLHLVIGRVVFVDFADQLRKGLSLHDSYLRIVSILTAFLWPAFTGLAILARPIVVLVYGEAWLDAALPLAMLSLAGVLYVAVTMTHEIYTVRGEVGRQVNVEFKRNLIGSILFAAGCFGGLGWAAASRIGDAAIIIFLAKKDLERLTQTQSSEYVPIYLRSGCLTLIACGPAFLLMVACGWSEQTSFPIIFVAVLVGVASWTLGLWYLRHPLYDEILSIARKLWTMGRGKI
uniref:oligosaccharide flippase family protein n=2 Tax=Methylobacterium sp. B34 TaxID=95563 RepID=UPI000345B68A|nr:oligosaccharide flippase family protein [Methylobacterium sp. B34]